MVDDFVAKKRAITSLNFNGNENGFLIESEIIEKSNQSALVEFTIHIRNKSYTLLRNVRIDESNQ